MPMTTRMFLFLQTLYCQANSKKGQTLVEYALVLSLVSVLTITYMTGLGEQIRSLYGYVTDSLATAFATLQ